MWDATVPNSTLSTPLQTQAQPGHLRARNMCGSWHPALGLLQVIHSAHITHHLCCPRGMGWSSRDAQTLEDTGLCYKA